LDEPDPVLAGRLSGKKAFVRILEQLPNLASPTTVFLDFHGIELATASYLDEVVVRLRDHLRLARVPGYLVACNLGDRVEEELNDLLIRGSEAMLACSLSESGHISVPCLLGSLDQKLRQTLDLIEELGEASASQLHADHGESNGIGPTAWNNRLNALSAKSLIVEISNGRLKKYRPVLETA